jgi:ribonuclease-3
MSQEKDLALLEEQIGYVFKDKTLLQTALTHSSFYNENRKKANITASNERLEFLGDTVLGIVISEYLFRSFSESDEGVLTQIRQRLVCESALASASRRISLGDYLFLGKGDDLGGARNRNSVLADALEALIAAVYLDSADVGLPTAKNLILFLMKNQLENCYSNYGDYKTQLQQLVEQDGNEILYYEVIEETGPAHERVFTVAAKLNSNTIGTGEGHTKREAEQKAAREALLLFGINKDLK